MTAGPGGSERGRVNIRVVPDTSKFSSDLATDLARITQEFSVQVVPNLDSEKLEREIEAASARLTVDIDPRVTKSDVKATIDKAGAAAVTLTPRITKKSIQEALDKIATPPTVPLGARITRKSITDALNKFATPPDVKLNPVINKSALEAALRGLGKASIDVKLGDGAKAKTEATATKKSLEDILDVVARLEVEIVGGTPASDPRILKLRRDLQSALAGLDLEVPAEAIRFADGQIDTVRARSALQAALDRIDNIDATLGVIVELDDSRLPGELRRIARELDSVPIGFDVEGFTAVRAKYDELRRRIEGAPPEIKPKLNVTDLDQRLTILATLDVDDARYQRLLNEINRDVAKLDVEVDASDVDRLKRQLDDLRRSLSDTDSGGRSNAFGGLLSTLGRLGVGLTFTQRQFVVVFLLLAPLGVAFVALAANIGQVVGVLATLPGFLLGAAGALGIIVPAVTGIVAAYQELTAVQDDATSSSQANRRAVEQAALGTRRAANEVGRAQRALADARAAVVTTSLAADEQVVRAQADIQRTLEDNARRLAEAESSLAAAILGEERAQERATAARQRAVASFRDLEDAVRNSGVGEAQAEAALEGARQRLLELSRSYDSEAGEIAEAILDVRAAELRLADSREDSVDAQNDLATAQSRGADGLTDVIDANRAVQDAQRDRAAAEARVAEAAITNARNEADARSGAADVAVEAARSKIAASEAVEDAELRITDAILSQETANQQVLESLKRLAPALTPASEAFDKLGDRAKALVRDLVDSKPRLDDFQQSLQDAFLLEVDDPLRNFVNQTLTTLEGSAPAFATALGEYSGLLLDAFSTPEAQATLRETIEALSEALEIAAPGAVALAEAFLLIVEAAAPSLPEVARLITEVAEQFADFLDGLPDSGEGSLEDFIGGAVETFGALLEVGEDVLGILGSIFLPADEAGQSLFDELAAALSDLNEQLKDPEKRAELLDFLERSVKAAIRFVELLPDLVDLLGDLIEAFILLNETIGPVVGYLFEAGFAAVDAYEAVFDLLGALTELDLSGVLGAVGDGADIAEQRLRDLRDFIENVFKKIEPLSVQNLLFGNSSPFEELSILGNNLAVEFINGMTGAFGSNKAIDAVGGAVKNLLSRGISLFTKPGSPPAAGPLSGDGWSTATGKAFTSDLASSLRSGRPEVESAARGIAGAAALDTIATSGLARTSSNASGLTSSSLLGDLRWGLEIDPVGIASIVATGNNERGRR